MSLELLYNCERERLKQKEDAVICCLHTYLTSNGLKCIGNGEQIANAQTVKCSDMLPSGWNDSGDIYVLTYRQEGTLDLFLMKALNVDGMLFINLMRERDEKVTEVEVLSGTFTTPNFKESFDTAFKGLFDLEKRVKRDLLGPFLSKPKTQEESTRAKDTPLNRDPVDPLRVPSSHPPLNPYSPNYGQNPSNPFPVGRSDLDPLSAGSFGAHGGMLYDPLRNFQGPGFGQPHFGGAYGGPSMIPRGSVPPGARFDPIGPNFGGGFNPNRSGGPDPDHLPPPGYNDMFM